LRLEHGNNKATRKKTTRKRLLKKVHMLNHAAMSYGIAGAT
jgi:hypothetical protein